MERIQPITVLPAPRTTAAQPETTPREDVVRPATAPVSEEATAEPAPGRETLAEAVSQLQESLANALPRNWHVGIHEDEDTGSTVIEIRDAEGEVVKQIPPEKVLNLQRKLDDLAGVVLDETT